MQKNHLIDIFQVADIFNKSIETIRKYKQMGLIEPCETMGRKDLFDRAEIIIRKKLIESLLYDNKQLNEIPSIIRQFEKSMPKNLTFKKGQKKLLIIDDEEAVRNLYSQMIAARFHEDKLICLSAADAESGLEIAQQIIPDLVILDIAFKTGMTGITLYKKFQSNPALEKTKIVFVSGKLKFHAEGTYFLGKPVRMDDLVDIVSTSLAIEPEEFI